LQLVAAALRLKVVHRKRDGAVDNNRAALVVPGTAPVPVVAVHAAAVAVGDTRATRDSERIRLRCKPIQTLLVSPRGGDGVQPHAVQLSRPVHVKGIGNKELGSNEERTDENAA
jgi:hypothetical protein